MNENGHLGLPIIDAAPPAPECPANDPGHCPHWKKRGFCCHCHAGLNPDEVTPRHPSAARIFTQRLEGDESATCIRCNQPCGHAGSVVLRGPRGLQHVDPPCPEAA